MDMLKKPEWLKKRLPLGCAYIQMESGLLARKLHTICQEGCCPNQVECFSKKEAAFLIMGRVCTRNCRFCAVESGQPGSLDHDEPDRLAAEVQELRLEYVVITSVTRDDLPDGGAGHYARVIDKMRQKCPDVSVEVLIPDFQGSDTSLATVISARPAVLNHNVETVPRLYRLVRPQSDYYRSVNLLARSKAMGKNIITKTGLMVGLGETRDEVFSVMDDLISVGCDILTIGQYLQPSRDHYSVKEYIHPDVFSAYENEAWEKGFKGVASSPFVRSSYLAGELYRIATGRSSRRE
jgi:lipoic acid synthetase